MRDSGKRRSVPLLPNDGQFFVFWRVGKEDLDKVLNDQQIYIKKNRLFNLDFYRAMVDLSCALVNYYATEVSISS